MATTAQTLITAAINSSLANDLGQTLLANNLPELVGVLDRCTKQVYADAAKPSGMPEKDRWDFFASSSTVTLTGSFVALPFSYTWTPQFYTNAGVKVAVVTSFDLNTGVAELAPAILLRQNQIKTAGRSGDPVSGNILTVIGTVTPATMTAATDYIGATTLSDATTTFWPENVGNPYLIAELALYLAIKASDRDPTELQKYTADRDRALSQVSGVVRKKQT